MPRAREKNGGQAIGRSRGGPSTKIHARVDAQGNPRQLHLTEGQVHDVTQAKLLLGNVRDAEVIGDKGYDADAVVAQAQEQGCVVVIPCRSNRKTPRALDQVRYKTRHLIENFFQRIKRARRIAMRFEKLAAHYLAMVQLCAIAVWL